MKNAEDGSKRIRIVLAGLLAMVATLSPTAALSDEGGFGSSFFGRRKAKPQATAVAKEKKEKPEDSLVVRSMPPEPNTYLLQRIPRAPARPGLPSRPKEPPRIPRDPKP